MKLMLSLASSVTLLLRSSSALCTSRVYGNTSPHLLTSFITVPALSSSSSSTSLSLSSSSSSSSLAHSRSQIRRSERQNFSTTILASAYPKIIPVQGLPYTTNLKNEVSVRMSSSFTDSNNMKDESEGAVSPSANMANTERKGVRQSTNGSTTGPKTSPPPLIDVDCNILHNDLASLIPDSSLPSSLGSISPQYFRVLHHPSTISSNIRAVFSPSSTIDEAELLHPLLIEREHERNNRSDTIDIRMGIGVHPYNTNDDGNGSPGILQKSNTDNLRARIDRILRDHNTDPPSLSPFVTCIGETGLDYSDGFPAKELQLPWFVFQLELARDYGLPLFLHEREASGDLLDCIDGVFPAASSSSFAPLPPVLVHCFTGSIDECREYVRRGYYISLSGYVLKKGDGPAAVRECLKTGVLPLDRLMLETDAPYMGFTSCRVSYYEAEEDRGPDGGDGFRELSGKKKKKLIKAIYPNVPSALPMVLDCVLECVNEGMTERDEGKIKVEDLAKILFDNSVNFFRFRV